MHLFCQHRRPFATLFAVLFLVVSTGVPITLPRPTEKSKTAGAERYPCENSPCGCSSSESCWRKCCCNTLAERLAWAKREGVRPPSFALDAAIAQGLDVSPWRYQFNAPKIVAKAAAKPVTRRACCCCKAKEAQEAPTTGRKKTNRQPGIAAWQALACQGLQQLWLAVAAYPPPAEITITTAIPQTRNAFAFSPLLVSSEAAPPPVPPPEQATRRFNERPVAIG